MAVVRQSDRNVGFGGFASRVLPAFIGAALTIQREEIALRKEVAEKEEASWEDVLTIAAIFNSDKKLSSPRRGKSGDLVVLKDKSQIIQVWFPASPPREVQFTPRPVHRLIGPRITTAMRSVLKEEEDVRKWL